MPLVIVQRGAVATFTLLTQTCEDRLDVHVVWDRRARDRRQTPSPVAEGERRRNLRRDPTTSWAHHHYLLASPADDSHADIRPREPLTPAAHLAVIALASRGVQEDIEAAVRSDVNLLLSGGDRITRRFLAHQIHHRSDRGAGPFVVVDHLGSVTSPRDIGRGRSRRGQVSVAALLAPSVDWTRGGTLFLEEIADLSETRQTEWLHALERGLTQRRRRRADASDDMRIIAATSDERLDQIPSTPVGADLFYRLNLIHVVVPFRDRQRR